MEKLPISIGILSWKSNTTLKNTINSYIKNGLFDIVYDIKIFFQEFSTEDQTIADNYGLQYIYSSTNIGIGKAFVALANQSLCDNILLLEHDWVLIENKETTFNRLSTGLQLLNNNISAVKYRHRKHPGPPLFSQRVYEHNELNHYDKEIDAVSPHLLECIHWIDHPEKEFSDKITKKNNHFITTSKWANWTNNPCMYKKSFYLEYVPNFAGSGVDLEGKIGKWWNRQNFMVAHGEGLFTHNDLLKYGN